MSIWYTWGSTPHKERQYYTQGSPTHKRQHHTQCNTIYLGHWQYHSVIYRGFRRTARFLIQLLQTRVPWLLIRPFICATSVCSNRLVCWFTICVLNRANLMLLSGCMSPSASLTTDLSTRSEISFNSQSIGVQVDDQGQCALVPQCQVQDGQHHARSKRAVSLVDVLHILAGCLPRELFSFSTLHYAQICERICRKSVLILYQCPITGVKNSDVYTTTNGKYTIRGCEWATLLKLHPPTDLAPWFASSQFL